MENSNMDDPAQTIIPWDKLVSVFGQYLGA